MSKFHRLFEDTQVRRAYFIAASAEPLQEASIAKMNRRAKAGSKPTPSANQKPYNGLSAQEKKVVDRQVAADAKGFMDGYGKVERTKDGPMLVIDANPIKEYDKITSQNRYVEYEYSPPRRRGGTRYDSVDPDSVYDETVEAPLDDFANGTFRFVLRPYLVGFDKVQYLFDEDESRYTTSDGGWTDLLGAWDETWMDKMMFNARQALEKDGLKAMERTMQNDIPNLQEIEDAFVEALQDNNVSSSDF